MSKTAVMMPVVPASKRSNGFSIDSLISREPRKSPGPSTSRRSPESVPGSPSRESPGQPEGPRGSPPGRDRDRDSRHSLGSSLGSPRSQAGDLSPLSPRGGGPGAAPVPVPGGMTLGGAGSSFHPVHPGASLLNGLKGLYGAVAAQHDGVAGVPPATAAFHEMLGMHHPAALHPPPPPHPPTLPGLHVPPAAAHPGLPPHPLLLGSQRDPFSVYPWLLSRQGGYFGHPRLLGKFLLFSVSCIRRG